MTNYLSKKCNLLGKMTRRLYMKTHGFIRDEIAWKRISNPNSCDPKNMILEPFLFYLPWREIINRYGNK